MIIKWCTDHLTAGMNIACEHQTSWRARDVLGQTDGHLLFGFLRRTEKVRIKGRDLHGLKRLQHLQERIHRLARAAILHRMFEERQGLQEALITSLEESLQSLLIASRNLQPNQ